MKELEDRNKVMEENTDDLTKRTRIAERVRDELAEKLEFEAKAVRALSRVHDLMVTYIGYEEANALMKLYFQPNVHGGDNDYGFGSQSISTLDSAGAGTSSTEEQGRKLTMLMESVKLMVSRHTTGQVWKQSKQLIMKDMTRLVAAGIRASRKTSLTDSQAPSLKSPRASAKGRSSSTVSARDRRK